MHTRCVVTNMHDCVYNKQGTEHDGFNIVWGIIMSKTADRCVFQLFCVSHMSRRLLSCLEEHNEYSLSKSTLASSQTKLPSSYSFSSPALPSLSLNMTGRLALAKKASLRALATWCDLKLSPERGAACVDRPAAYMARWS